MISSFTTISTSQINQILIIYLDRPKKLNAFNCKFWKEFTTIFETLDETIRGT